MNDGQRETAEGTEGRAQEDRDRDPEQPEVVAVAVVLDEQGHGQGGCAHHAGGREVDRPHHQHERDAAGDDRQHGGGVQDVLDVVDAAELRAQGCEHQEDDDQRDRRPERHPPPGLGARRYDVDVLGGGCHRHDSGPATRSKTLSHSKAAGSVFGVRKSPTFSSVIRNCSA
jgi:hypothetical protein